MKNNIKEWYEPILLRYRLRPEYVEQFGNTHKVVTDNGLFALKELKRQQQGDFVRHIQFLYQKGYYKVAPILRTVDGEWLVSFRHQLFYLMPWFQSDLKEERAVHQYQMLRELARLHYVSAEKITQSKEELTKIYENISNDWAKKLAFLENFVERCEKKWYMSPYELQFFTVFHETIQAGQFAQNQLKKWYEVASEKGNARVVVNHGKVSCRHFVYDQNQSGLFISFEKARITLPIYDLIGYYHRVLRTYPIKCDECKEWYYHYQKYFPYTEDEKALFFSYLVFPEQIYRAAKSYLTDNLRTEQQSVAQLQKVYWQMKNIEYFMMCLHEEENMQIQEKEATT